ncbi:MAG: metal ABC transporter permease [Granulosicoccus sp.]|nr:metal ABC transporter permease [Granulosicoccus sp.]
MDDFVLRASLAGLLVALLCAPLGCLVVWQRMSYFGAALSHAALLGVALGFLIGIPAKLAILVICIITVFLLVGLEQFKGLATDTLLGILAHASLAFGLIVIALLPNLRVDLMAYLFGDILTVSWQDLGWIISGGALILLICWRIWAPILSTIVHPDLAFVDGHQRKKLRFTFLMILALFIALTTQVVGLLLIVSLLIIPAAVARPFSRSPEQMLLGTVLSGIASVALGIFTSFQIDVPAGPAIVASASVLFAVSFATSRLPFLAHR